MFHLFIQLCWVLVAVCGIFQVQYMGSSSLTRKQTQAPCIGSTESWTWDHQGSPRIHFLIPRKSASL